METRGKRSKDITVEEIISTIKTLEVIECESESIVVKLKQDLISRVTDDNADKIFSLIDSSIFLFEPNVPLIRILLKCPNINVNVRNRTQKTPLMMTKDENIAQMLLSHPSIDVNAKDADDWTTLMTNVGYYHSRKSGKIIQMLLAHPMINVNERGREGWSALLVAARYSNEDSSEEVVKMLLEHPSINVNQKTDRCNTALILAIENINKDSNEKTVQLLLSHPSIDVNAKNVDGLTALHISAADENSVSTMIAIGSRLDTQDFIGAIPYCKTDKCKLMLYAMIRSQRIGNLPKHICKIINLRVLIDNNKVDLSVLSKMMGLPGASRMDLSDILSAGHYYYNEKTYQIQRARRLGAIQTILRPMTISLIHGLSDIAGIDPTDKTLEQIKKLLE